MIYNFTLIYPSLYFSLPLTQLFPSPGHYAFHFSVPTASPLCLTVFHLEEILGFTLKMTADTLQTLTKLEAERSRKIRRIMNKFPSHPHGQDILFTTQFFGSLYPVNEISNTCEGAAFKLLFSLEAWRWKKKKRDSTKWQKSYYRTRSVRRTERCWEMQ